jgi:hypothetical protein
VGACPMSAAAKPRFRLKAPVVPEHSLQKQICDCLRLEIAPPGKVSRAGVCWYSIDHANFAGEIPGIRIGRGIIAGILDIFVLYQGRAHFIEIKTDNGELSDAQQAVGTALLVAGGRVGVVRDAVDTIALIDAWAIPRARRIRGAA